jgi:hypothetical protein
VIIEIPPGGSRLSILVGLAFLVLFELPDAFNVPVPLPLFVEAAALRVPLPLPVFVPDAVFTPVVATPEG